MSSSPDGHAAIRIRGARTHNLKNIDLDLPRDRLTVITGPSGSGKSSLAFDTLYAEGQRRYVESLSAYARQFLSVMEKPDVDHIEGLSPAISIEQKSTSHNPRSTVGTITEIYDYLRLLFARVGEPQCPDHGVVLRAQTVSQMVDTLLALPQDTRVMLLAPVVAARKGEHAQLLEGLRGRGYVRARIDGTLTELDAAPQLDAKRKHDIEVVVDRLRVRPDAQSRLADSVEAALGLGDGLLRVAFLDEPRDELLFSARFACPHCGYSVAELEPRLFSFNNPAGACPECDGLGMAQFFDPLRIVAHPRQSLAAGAIPGWDRRNAYYMHILEGLARHYGFDVETPFEDLAEMHQQVLLYGSGEEAITFTYGGADGRGRRKRHPFEGVVNNFARRYRETDSNAVREHLSRFLGNRPCTACGGSRLRREARHVFVAGRNLPELVELPVGQAQAFFAGLDLPGARGTIAQKILREIEARLGFLVNVGLDYLTLSRSADTLSGGEAQRIRLASQIGAGLVGVLYVLDEPSIGLHQRDNQRLLSTLTYLRDLGNTVIVIEHDEDAMRLADHLIDIGPGAGEHGGYVIAEGTPEQVASNPDSVTGQYLSGKRAIALPTQRTPVDPERVLRIEGASGNNLKDVTVDIPLGLFTCVTGVSGSGKSTLINETLAKAVAQKLNQAREEPAPYRALHGLDQLDKIVNIDQSPIGRTPRSNPATYTGLFTPIRELLAGTPEARARAYGPGRFSFNVAGGRCEACQGDGMLKVEMHFLADIYVPCDVCHGQRYNRETLEIQYKGRNIHQILDMTVEQAGEFFSAVPQVKRKLDTLDAVGLGYIRLGQAATTLSGGEAQRVKLSRELSKRDTGRTLYILDEPTTGLHFQDIELLLGVLTRLRDDGNTLVVIEHNLDVIKTADWVIDLGPEGGSGGGEIIACGTPEDLALEPRSHTGRFLAPLLKRQGQGDMRAPARVSAAPLTPPQRGLVYASAFFGITTESLIGMLLPLWALARGLPPAQLGTAVALASLSPLLLAVPAGALCDRYGDRQVMLLAGVGAAVTAALYPLAGGFLAACGLQLLGGLARSMSWLSAQSYAIRAAPSGERNTFMGRFSFAGSIGMLLAPLAAGALVDWLGLTAGFLLMAVWGGLLAAVALPLPDRRDGVAEGTLWQVTGGAYRQALPLLAQASLMIVMMLTLLRLSAAAVNASFYPVHLDQAGFSPASIGLMFACINGATSVGSLAAAALIRRTSMTQVLFGSIALSVLAISLVPFVTSPLAVGTLSALHGLGLGLSLPTLLTAIGRQTAAHQRGLVIGLRTLFNRLGYFAVPVLLGGLVHALGLRGAFLATGALLLIGLAVGYACLRRLRINFG